MHNEERIWIVWGNVQVMMTGTKRSLAKYQIRSSFVGQVDACLHLETVVLVSLGTGLQGSVNAGCAFDSAVATRELPEFLSRYLRRTWYLEAFRMSIVRQLAGLPLFCQMDTHSDL